MKKLGIIYIFCLVLLVSIMGGAGVKAATPCVNDMAGYFDEAQVKTLTETFERIKLDYNFDVVFVSEENMSGSNIDATAEEVYVSSGYGIGENHDGIMLYICKAEREYSLYSNGSAISIINNSRISKLEDEVVGYLKSDQYYEACMAYADMVKGYLENPNGGKILNAFKCFGIAVAAGLVLAFILTFAKLRQMNTVSKQRTANSYVTKEGMNLSNSQDIYLYSHVTKRAKPKQNSSSGSSSGGGRSTSGKF